MPAASSCAVRVALGNVEEALVALRDVLRDADHDGLEAAHERLTTAVAALTSASSSPTVEHDDIAGQVRAVRLALARCCRLSSALHDVATHVLASAGFLGGYGPDGHASERRVRALRIRARA